jgi:hypothetical protein
MGFKPTTPVFEQAKTVHALDCAATVIGLVYRFSDKDRYPFLVTENQLAVPAPQPSIQILSMNARNFS